jgi:hypothetical protein
MVFYKFTSRDLRKDIGVFFVVGAVSCLILAVGVSFFKVYEDSMRVTQRARIVASIVREQGNILFHEPAGTASTLRENEEGKVDVAPLCRWIIERFSASNTDPRIVSRDLKIFLSHTKNPPEIQVGLNRWQAALDRWSSGVSAGISDGSEDFMDSAPLSLLMEGRQHYFESAGFRRIGKSFDGTVLNLWTISLLSAFVEKYPLHPAVPEALFMIGDEYLNLGRALPKNAKNDRILNLVSELYPDSVWSSRAIAVWKSEHIHAI